MPANRKLANKYKVLVGRYFTLRKFALIPVFTDDTSSMNEEVRQMSKELIGDGVLILDESKNRVRILAGEQTVWIQKYYLLKELTEVQHPKHRSADTYNELLLKISELSIRLNDNTLSSTTEKERSEFWIALQQVMQHLRHLEHEKNKCIPE